MIEAKGLNAFMRSSSLALLSLVAIATKANPRGAFTDMNSTVSCDHASAQGK